MRDDDVLKPVAQHKIKLQWSSEKTLKRFHTDIFNMSNVLKQFIDWPRRPCRRRFRAHYFRIYWIKSTKQGRGREWEERVKSRRCWVACNVWASKQQNYISGKPSLFTSVSYYVLFFSRIRSHTVSSNCNDLGLNEFRSRSERWHKTYGNDVIVQILLSLNLMHG